ncbi:hypothetical protein HGRIS_006983 [Hohenbuehelia grisea]|uniref:Uncharacterized protein n=1 Tax=Hohenbuehelia grisea TaxID=104357 RepID=A0ABR3JAS8_9AGAR
MSSGLGVAELIFTVVVSATGLTFLIFFVTGKRSEERARHDQQILIDELRAGREERRHTENYQWNELRDMMQTMQQDLAAQRRRTETEPPRPAAHSGIDSDLRPLILDLVATLDRDRDHKEERRAEKEGRRQDKDFKWIELRDMVHKIHDDLETDRQRVEELRAVPDRSPDVTLEEVQRCLAEQRELINQTWDSLRGELLRGHEETLAVVRETAGMGSPPLNMHSFLDDFTRSLSKQVHLFLDDVGKLREHRRILLHEISYLLGTKSKFGPAGEFDPEWNPTSSVQSGIPPPMPPSVPETKPEKPTENNASTTPKFSPAHEPPSTDEPAPKPSPDRKPASSPLPLHQDDAQSNALQLVVQPDPRASPASAWRAVPHRRKSKKKEKLPSASAPPPPPVYQVWSASGSSSGGKKGNTTRKDSPQGDRPPSWATWQPDPSFAPSPPSSPSLVVSGRSSPGLFGPRSPGGSDRE